MKRLFKISLIVLFLASLIGMQACQKDESEITRLNDGSNSELKSQSMNTFYSSTLPMGKGVARAWVMASKNGEPLSVGINFSARALENLPDEPAMFSFMLPKNKGMNFYTHVMVDWNPTGHDPIPIYGLPHFDFHFYIVPVEDRLKVPLILPPTTDPPVDSKYVPAGYEMDIVTVPQMGTHWVDKNSPEWNGATFTKTFIWGSYEGEFTFWEPMITKDYLLTMPDETVAITQPGAFQKSGYYPTHYKISYSENPDEYTVALTNLVYHKGE